MTASEHLALIACVAAGRVIGDDGSIPWDYPEDRAHFKRMTMGHTLLVGRKTYESIGGLLVGRRMIVLTRNHAYRAAGTDICHSFEAALKLAHETDECPFVCGGEEVYTRALRHATQLYLTEIQRVIPGDTLFPDFDESCWHEVSREETGDLTFRHLTRSIFA